LRLAVTTDEHDLTIPERQRLRIGMPPIGIERRICRWRPVQRGIVPRERVDPAIDEKQISWLDPGVGTAADSSEQYEERDCASGKPRNVGVTFGIAHSGRPPCSPGLTLGGRFPITDPVS